MSLAGERGRQPIVSTGRGGAGNLLRSQSRGVDADTAPGAERGRELSPHPVGERITHSGRGGAGNIRPSSHSRTREQLVAEEKEDQLQGKLVAEARGRQAEQAFSTGRGGVGNINRSKSRSRSAVRDKHHLEEPISRTTTASGATGATGATNIHSSGRGGFGNITEEHHNHVDLEKQDAQAKYDAEVLAKHKHDEAAVPHHSGKGGAGNVHGPGELASVDMHALTLEEREAYAKVHSGDKAHWLNTGRGGAGNMIPPSQSSSKEHSPASADGEGSRGRGEHHKGGMLNNVLRSISRATGREKSVDRHSGHGA